MANINIRIDQKLKQAASEVLSNVGLDMSSAVKLFLTQTVIAKSIPFPIITENGFTLEEEREILRDRDELMRDIATGKVKSHKSAREMINSILNEPDDEDV